ncbi:ATP-binding protein [Brucellaceae bacterium C25G]
MTGKFNPFRPDKVARPGMFSGRYAEIKFIESCLLQTKNGNPKHFMITGERGIGKSSLVLLQKHTASGNINAISSGEKFNFLVLNVSLRREDTFLSIIDRIARELRKQISKENALANILLKSIDFLSRIEAAGVKFNRDNLAGSEDESLSVLQDDFETTILKLGDSKDGILLLIDEADRPPHEANLGLLCKLLTEELSLRDCDKLCIGLSGLPAITSKLRDSHDSSLRLFHILSLKPLELEERKHVLDTGISEANKKNIVPASIDPDTAEMICNFSEGYPHFLQEFAYCAFEEDDDNVISSEDFLNSLFSENGAFDQLGAKYFDRSYSTPASDDYRRVLDFMSEHGDGWVPRSSIVTGTSLKGGTVDNALRALKLKDIIFQDEARAGYYRLPTRSFAVWISLRKKAEIADVDINDAHDQ